MGFILPAQQGIIQKQGHVAGIKIEWHFLVFPEDLAALYLDVRNRKRDELFNRPLARGKAYPRRGNVVRAVGIDNAMRHTLLENQRIQTPSDAHLPNPYH